MTLTKPKLSISVSPNETKVRNLASVQKSINKLVQDGKRFENIICMILGFQVSLLYFEQKITLNKIINSCC